jgi:hypothetical protein
VLSLRFDLLSLYKQPAGDDAEVTYGRSSTSRGASQQRHLATGDHVLRRTAMELEVRAGSVRSCSPPSMISSLLASALLISSIDLDKLILLN